MKQPMERESEGTVAFFAAEESERESTRTVKNTEHQSKLSVLPDDTVWKCVAGR